LRKSFGVRWLFRIGVFGAAARSASVATNRVSLIGFGAKLLVRATSAPQTFGNCVCA
jgi:hypothetical protein